ncbi:MAG: insulinase family protein [bacterium]|nr:insulinase family protein [bacterium]
MKNLLRLIFLSTLLFVSACTTTQVPIGTPPEALAPEAPQLPAGAATQELVTAPLTAELPVDPAVRIGRLDNGLSYYIRAHQKPEQRAELRLVVNAGSLQEDDDQQGLAHFIEHMAFNGTRHFEKQELLDYLESIGMRFAADLNAHTSFDETTYVLKVPTDDPDILAKAFLILEDWAWGITLEGEEIDAERGVMVEEWRLGRGAGARIRDQQIPILFRGSRYVDRLPIGLKEVIEEAPYEALRRFYRDWYRPELMAVVAVGDFDPNTIEDLIVRHFQSIPASEAPRERVVYPVPDHEETLWGFTTDPETAQTSVTVYYKLPRQSRGSYGDYRRSLVKGLYDGMLNGRLYEIGQQADPPFLFGVSGAIGLVRSRSVHMHLATVREGEVERGLEALLTEVERVDRHGFTQTELDRMKQDFLRGYEQVYRERDKVNSAGFAAEYVGHFLEGEPIPGIELELELVRRFLPAIDLEEVNGLAQSWITEENRVILVTGPDKEGVELPDEEALRAVFEALEAEEIPPWVDQVLDAPLLAEIPQPGAVVSERTIAELEVTEWRLANGVRVVLKPTDFRNDQIVVTGFSPGGHSLVDDERHTSATFATAILSEGGLGQFSRIELEKALAGKVAGVNASIAELEEGIAAWASPEDLETTLQLLYLTFTSPRSDDQAYQSLMAKMRIALENRLSRPATVFQDKLTEVLAQGHPRRRPLTEERLEEVDPTAALEIYRDRFADAGDFTFLVVGNFEPAEIRPLLETYLGGLPAIGREESWRDVGVRRPEGVVRFEVRRGIEPKSQVSLIFSGPAEWSREGQHQIRSLGAVLSIRLRERLREDLGATYGVGAAGSLSSRPIERYSVALSFGCSPEEVENLIGELFEELELIKQQGVEDSYLTKVREAQRRKRETDLKENSFWLRALHSYYSHDLDPQLILAYDELIDRVTSENMQEAARRYLDPQRYVLGVLYPEEEAADDAAESTAAESTELPSE